MAAQRSAHSLAQAVSHSGSGGLTRLCNASRSSARSWAVNVFACSTSVSTCAFMAIPPKKLFLNQAADTIPDKGIHQLRLGSGKVTQPHLRPNSFSNLV